MSQKTMLISLFAGAMLAGAAGAAQAAPLNGAQQAAPEATTQAEAIAYRRCWWHNGHRHCRWVGTPRVYGYRYGSGTYNRYGIGSERPESYPAGSTAWWRAMDRDNRGGHGIR